MRRLFVAIDGSENGGRVIEHLVLLDRENGPLELHVCHVAPEPAILGEVEVYVSPVESKVLQEAALDRALRPAQARLTEAGITHQVHRLIAEDPAEAIASHAEALGCDTIVLGTHARGALANLFLGSVATGVVRRTKLPVLLVK